MSSTLHTYRTPAKKTPARAKKAQNEAEQPKKSGRKSAKKNTLTEDVAVVLEKVQIPELDPEIVFKKLETVSESPIRVSLVCRDILKNSPEVKVKNGRKVFSPAPKQKKLMASNGGGLGLGLSSSTFYGTPKSMDPSAVLKRKLKTDLDEKVKDRMDKLPPSSPYALLQGKFESCHSVQ